MEAKENYHRFEDSAILLPPPDPRSLGIYTVDMLRKIFSVLMRKRGHKGELKVYIPQGHNQLKFSGDEMIVTCAKQLRCYCRFQMVFKNCQGES